jgi:hypothetical protein
MGKAVTAAVVVLMAAIPSRAEVVFKDPAIELGNLRTGQVLEQTLTYWNRGKATVELVEAKGSCACLLPQFTARSLPAGQSGTLKMNINTLGVTGGQQAWRLTLRYKEAGQLQEAAVVLRATITQEIIVQPPEIIVYADGPTRHEVAVLDIRARPLRVTKAESSSPYFQVTLQPERQDAGGRVVKPIALEIGPNLPVGRHDEQLVIYTDDPVYRELKVTVTAVRRNRQRYTAIPPAVALYASVGDRMVSRMVTIRDRQGQPLTIDYVAATDPAIQCEWSKGASTVANVKVTVDCTKVTTERFESKITIGLVGGEKLTLPVSCEAR